MGAAQKRRSIFLAALLPTQTNFQLSVSLAHRAWGCAGDAITFALATFSGEFVSIQVMAMTKNECLQSVTSQSVSQ